MRLRAVLIALAGAHLAFCIGRVPHAVVWKRWQEITAFRSEGDLENLFRRAELEGAQHVRWLQQNTPERSAILFAGEIKGPLEFAAAALWPRPLVNAQWVGAQATEAAGRPLAQGTLPDGASGALLLRGERRALHLEVRR